MSGRADCMDKRNLSIYFYLWPSNSREITTSITALNDAIDITYVF